MAEHELKRLEMAENYCNEMEILIGFEMADNFYVTFLFLLFSFDSF